MRRHPQRAALAGLSFGLLLGACAAPVPRPGAVASAANEVQCTTERPTGSMLPVRTCTTRAQRTAIDRATRETNQAIQRLPGRACPGTPGCTTT